MAQTTSSQLGAAAIAHPSAGGGGEFPAPVPELHHLNMGHDEARQEGSTNGLHHDDDEDNDSKNAPSTNKDSTHDSTKDSTKHSTNDEDDLTFPDLPPFLDNVPTAPLLRLKLAKLLSHDAEEEERLWQACRELGFFYLDLRSGPGISTSSASSGSKRDSAHSSSPPNPSPETKTNAEERDSEEVKGEDRVNGPALLHDATALFHLGARLFSLPTPEKELYDFNSQGSYFGYKGLGAGVVDAKGTRDGNEFYNVSKNDVLGISERLPAPEVLRREESRRLLGRFCEGSHGVVGVILGLLGRKLGLPKGRLEELHRLRAVSGDQVRWVRSPPPPASQQHDAKFLALGEHTDFGSVTVLFNRLGGLQILPPSTTTTTTTTNNNNNTTPEWHYVKPLPHHCVVNLGDALVKFTAGILRSNLHRVVPPPGEQAGATRMSLVYFARPEDEVVLKVLEGSGMIDEEKEKGKRDGGGGEKDGGGEEEITAKEWILRRALGRRAGGDWEKSHGTEGARVKQ
ncbi:hypothetical protein B0A55_09518 [Friedmanniomyces simplex]|uniref:Fe2OG dioxygenase domain-containing protein n=1 Tax=Friedmanniomyces simplex TaxID=329884 RepID=A0A4U0WY07_9PEZI|nr:hypothetical protein B0A55_09518 [Friedmanniomyces simplex]